MRIFSTVQGGTDHDPTNCGGFRLLSDGRGWKSWRLAQDKDIDRPQRSFWVMHVNLETPDLAPPAVQWAVLDKDPVPAFRDRIKRVQGFYKTSWSKRKMKPKRS